MPEFIPEHIPASVDESSFLGGYLGAAEWLIDEDVDRRKLRGWTKAALRLAKEDCAKFEKDNESDLQRFYELTGRGEDLAGYCFWLSRNGHGAGFFDRGKMDDPVYDRLQDAAESFRTRDVDCHFGWISLI